MASAIEGVLEADGTRNLTVSIDGAWLTRGHSSIHGFSALCSTTKRPKAIDTHFGWLILEIRLDVHVFRKTEKSLFSRETMESLG